MKQKTFFQYYLKLIIPRAVSRAWRKFGAIGTFLGFVLPVLTVIMTRRPTSLAEFFSSDAVITAEMIVGLFALVLIIYVIQEPMIIYNTDANEKRRMQNRLSELTKTKPNIIQPKFGFEVTPLNKITQNVFGKTEHLGYGDIVERYYIEFQNKKRPRIITEDADDIYVKISFFNLKHILKIHDKPRWKGHYDPFDEKTWYPKIDLKASGKPQQLYLAIRKQSDEKLFIFGQESHKYESFIAPNLELKEKTHYIQIELSAQNLDVINYWVKIENKSSEHPVFTLLKSRPTSLKNEK